MRTKWAGTMLVVVTTDAVTSPTYALMHAYPTPQGSVLHVDAYRVRDVNELYEMDLEDLIRQITRPFRGTQFYVPRGSR